MKIERWAGSAVGRSQAVARADLVWTVANARPTTEGFAAQVAETFSLLEQNLERAGSSRRGMLSVQVLLTDIGNRDEFDRLWRLWIGDDPEAWPQRACYGAALAPGLLVELIVTAARS